MKKTKRKSKTVRRVKLKKQSQSQSAWSKAADVINRVFGSWNDKPVLPPEASVASKRKSRKKVSFKLKSKR